MSDTSLHRRRFLVLAGAATAAGLAGCTTGTPSAGGQPGGNDDTTSPPTSETHGGDDHDDSDHTETGDHHDGTPTDGHHGDEQHHTEDAPHTDDGHGSAGPESHVEVEMQTLDTGHHFHPHVAWVEVGGTVTFHNVSGAHTATAYHPDNGKPDRLPEGAAPFDSGLLTETGATFEHTFEVEGVYDVYCAPHEELGMIGSVLVGEPDPHDQPGLAGPQDELSEPVASKIVELNGQVDTMLGHEH